MYPAATTNSTRIALGWRVLAWMALCTAIGLLNANHFYLNDAANGRPGVFLPRLADELTGAWSAGALVLLVAWTLGHLRRQPQRWLRYVGHLLLLVVFSLLHTSLIWASRLLLYPLLGLAHYDYGVLPWRYAMEFPSDVIVYALTVCVTWLLAHYRANRARELHAAQLASALAAARLEALRLQLNPHFLFNALNAVSSILYERPRDADEMLARIGDLLRATLGAQAQEHSLADELRLLNLYLDIQRTRFGEALELQLDVAPGIEAARVPFLLLQPLVENAIEHASGDRRWVALAVRAHGDQLQLTVADRGDGPHRSDHHGHGIGLSNLQARLQHLYAEAAGVSLHAGHDGGCEARLWLPLRQQATA
jgi:two-component sensor histidine kinase